MVGGSVLYPFFESELAPKLRSLETPSDEIFSAADARVVIAIAAVGTAQQSIYSEG